MPVLRPWSRWLDPVRGTRLALVLAAALALPSAGMGFFLDDNLHHVQAQGAAFVGGPFDQFTFLDGDPAHTVPFVRRGPFPWWTLPELKLSFLRPLSSALITLDAALFGDRAWLHHLHSIGWYLLWILAASLLLRTALPSAAGTGALLLLAIDDVHWLPTAWLANRNALVATAPALLATWAHVKRRTGGGGRFLVLELAGVLVAFSGGEASLGALGFLLAWELFAATDGVRDRARGLVPVGVLSLSYIAVYRWSGAGAFGSATYVDPVSSPLAFLSAAPERLLALLGGLVFGIPVDAWMGGAAARLAYSAVGVLALVLVAWAHVRVRARLAEAERRGLDWLVGGALLSLVPVLATFPAGRLLLVPSIGGAAFVAVLLRELWSHPTPNRRWAARGLVFAHVVVSLASWPVSHAVGYAVTASTERTAFGSPLTDAEWEGRVVMPAAPDFSAMMLPVMRRRIGRPLPASWWILSFGKGEHLLRRTGERTLELSMPGDRLLGAMWETQLRAPSFPLEEGAAVRLDGMTVTARDVVDGRPARIELAFDTMPDDPPWTWVRWEDFRLVRFTPPPPGGEVRLPREPGPLGP